MMGVLKMTFDEWLNEVEVYSTRVERLMEELGPPFYDTHILLKWLKAAYKVGYEQGLEDDPYEGN